MRAIKVYMVLALVAGFGLPGVVQALDTATELRLRSIEARLPDADRLDALERKIKALSSGEGAATGGAVSGGGSFSLLQDVESLKDDVRKLRGEVEELNHQIEQSKQGQRELFQNLDKRVQALEEQGSLAPSGQSTGDSGDNNAASTGGASNTPVDEAAAKDAYQSAFGLLKEGKYSESRKAFDAFVKKYPNSEYSDNAYYWLGEAHYVDREYEPALAAFRKVTTSYGDSSKAPGALYKVGVIQDEQGNTSQARTTLIKVVEQYPDDNAAELARKRLKAMGGNGSGN